MPERLFRLYQRKRIVNINANIVAAGLLAIVPAAGVVWLAEQGLQPTPRWPFPLIGIGADVIFDVALYYGLHWVANHWRPSKGKSEHEKLALEAAPPPFLRDATIVQIERALLSPLYYVVAAGLMHSAQLSGIRPAVAFLIGFPAGLVVTRVLHTVWGLRTGRFRDHAEMSHNHSAPTDRADGAPSDPADAA